jgi:hypothetical protein
MSPPFGPDEKVQAIHALSVIRAARELVAAITRCGGAARVRADSVRDEIASLCDETNRLAVYEARAAARGSVKELSDARLSAAVDELRRTVPKSVDEEEILDMTDDDVAETFSADALTKPPDDDPFNLDNEGT